MRQRDPRHDSRLQELLAASPEEFKHQICVKDYRLPGYVASEVLASLVRAQYGKDNGILEAVAKALHLRVVARADAYIRRKVTWHEIIKRKGGDETVQDAMQYVWEKLMSDKQPVCNAEVRFDVYLTNKIDDYMRHLLTEENTRPSVEDILITDEDGKESNLINLVEDPNGETPEQIMIGRELSAAISSTLKAMPRNERNAYYFRIQCQFDWKKVAALLKCSVPTASALVNRSLEKLQGVLE